MITKQNLAEGFATFREPWSPRVAGDINDMQIKLAKLEGAFVSHSHAAEDELFLVVSGRLRMEFRDQEAQVLEPGEFIIVPRGTEHRPVPRRSAKSCSWSRRQRSTRAMSSTNELSGG